MDAADRELHPAFVQALREQRDGLNTRYHLRRRAGARIERDALLRHLRDVVEPIVREVHAVVPDRVAATLTGLYETSLDLLGASLLGVEPKTPVVDRVWRDVLPRLPKLVAQDARDVAGRLSNAVQHVAGQPGARPDAWIERMQRVAAHCTSIAQLLDCGRAAAWLSGLVQYRPAGLKAMQALPAELACLIADAPPGTSALQWASACQRLADDPWLTVAAALTDDGSSTAIALTGTAGAFRGFGGLFRQPPTASFHDGALLVDDGESEWGLLADAYGQYFHRTGAAPRTVRKSRPRGDVTVDRSGRVRWGKMEGTFPFLADAASIACDGMTLAVTIPTSHHVFLLARRGAAQ